MNRGVKMLLARMDSNPEEFTESSENRYEDSGKWDRLVSEIHQRMEFIDRDNGYDRDPPKPVAELGFRHVKPLAYLTDEEATLLYSKLLEARRGVFDQRVMKVLLGGDEIRSKYTTTQMSLRGVSAPSFDAQDYATEQG